MIHFLYTKQKSWLQKWDEYITAHPKGSHLMCSDWLKSYQSYGFDYEIGLVLNDQIIVGGFGVVIPKFFIFKFYILPHGPVYDEDFETALEKHLNHIINRARCIGCCYLQLSMPISSNSKISDKVYGEQTKLILQDVLKPGKLFKHIYTSYGLNWIDFSDYENASSFLKKLTPKVRRNIRMPYNKGAIATFVTDSKIIESGYKIILENAKAGNYSVRKFSDFKQTIQNFIDKKRGYFIVCEVDSKIKAAAFFVKSNGYITNITGGVQRDKPDIKLGYMLQWEIIKKSFDNHDKGYNISMGGSEGVQDFKAKFGGKPFFYEGHDHHLVLNPTKFKIFKYFEGFINRYKNKLSKILSSFQ